MSPRGLSQPSRALPLYLGPALARWQPGSVADVQAVIDNGSLAERHWLDAKKELGNGDSANRELARDLASFANAGGALLYGVAEPNRRQLVVTPIPLEGLPERVDQVARSRCDPPLYVICHPLLDPEAPGLGVLVVEVPPSPAAPHMVDGRYYGRGDTTRHQLADPEVAQLHAARSTRQLTAEQLIAAEVGRDPVPSEQRERSHLFCIAQPLTSPPDLLTDLLGTPALTELVGRVGPRVPSAHKYPPNWGSFQGFQEPRADGVGFSSFGLRGRRFQPEIEGAREEGLLDLEVTDAGKLTLFCGRASAARLDRQYVFEPLVVVLTRCLVTLAGMLGGQAGYAGRWLLAVGMTDLAGKRSSIASADPFGGSHLAPFSANHYVQGTEAVTAELLERPGTITRRLAGRLLRALGVTSGQYDSLLAE